MAFESGQRGHLASQINVTPLVDVMLVLLIIFMVTAPIIQQGVEVQLAARSRPPRCQARKSSSWSRSPATREIYLNDTRIGC